MRWIFYLIPLTFILGCGGELEQLAVETLQNAHVAIAAAEESGAPDTAKLAHRTAQEMLTTAEDSMNAGDAKHAYRLALRAYLHARIATETAIALREEAAVAEAQAELRLSKQELAAALQRLEVMKAELDALQTF